MRGRPQAVADTTAYDVLVRCFRRAGYAPTVEEYRAALGVGSTRTALRYLRRLEDAGQIKRWPGARGIALSGSRGVTMASKMAEKIVDRIKLDILTLAAQGRDWTVLPVAEWERFVDQVWKETYGIAVGEGEAQ